MCGIAGFTHLTKRADDGRIREATYSLIHRGPDEQGVHETRLVSLGAVRLKIIDLVGGDQPMMSPDGGTVIVFNGEIYNHEELRAELISLGHTFQSRSDTEVLLHAFLEWDTDCFSKLRGMFGVGFWNESQRRLVLARDRMGIKPLYYYRHGRDLFFGSELKAILVHPEVDRRLNLAGLNHYLSLNYVPCPHTLIDGIVKLPPGHWLEWQDGEVRTEAYWKLKLQPETNWTLESAKEALDNQLRVAVREHLISDVPLGVWLSGGLDSSAILHYAAQEQAHLKTFSISFQGNSCDESPYFREVAEKYGTEHHEFDMGYDVDMVSAIEQFAYYSDEPSADAGALPVWFLSQMCRREITVALSGEGADELFGGYLTFRADLIAQRLQLIPAILRRLGASGAELLPISDKKISFEYKVRRMLRGSLLSADERHSYWNGTFSAEEQSRIYDRTAPDRIADLYAGYSSSDSEFLTRYLWFDQYYFLPDDILYKCDRMSMAHSLEVRPAFLDHRVVELAARFPSDLKVHGSNQKYVLRELMRDKLPAAVLTRKKEGFDIPAHKWLRESLKPLLLDTITEDAVRNSGVFRWPGIRAVIDAHLERRGNYGYHLWGLLMLFLWMRRWNVTDVAGASDEKYSLLTKDS